MSIVKKNPKCPDTPPPPYVRHWTTRNNTIYYGEQQLVHDIAFETRKTRGADRSPWRECTARYKSYIAGLIYFSDLPTDENDVPLGIAAFSISKLIYYKICNTYLVFMILYIYVYDIAVMIL